MLLYGWAPCTDLINHICHISSSSQRRSEQLSSDKWIIQMTTVPAI